MKFLKIAVMAGALLGSLPVAAQKLEYRDFKLTNEATARLQGTSVTDENSGKKAALIKIYTPFPNDVLGFDAGLFQILGRKQAGPGEVWLYVPERTQKVTVNHPKYSPKVIWFDGMEAEAGKTYSVELNVEGRNVALIASTPMPRSRSTASRRGSLRSTCTCRLAPTLCVPSWDRSFTRTS